MSELKKRSMISVLLILMTVLAGGLCLIPQQAKGQEVSPDISITAVGDVMLGRNVDKKILQRVLIIHLDYWTDAWQLQT
ncbi:MAG: hypothetical protein PHU36_03540 [Syntrophomonadaceae bacterium]|nr:hypothetical protein [Syntrophomonadaceae bacterium]